MSTSAIVMMAVAIAVVWGGLVATVLWIWRHPEHPEQDPPA
ncbi:methionine/alanine import family NSS transporter small subunit [Lipingzhangella sp. LS1_29]|uniref:Methionine/alanine import family NSS transporter small subunit n=1 Tax=Lipingzhangella rawalii TaxID=2055835 RepID=A0ABU2H4V3_9ACTN|nr:methionine/alanine import family NSS transporter small subunit [Lipingzhangella rawalii]MDS1270331.1 methionine/alanine import family NSS transporter small subunit [Lipingzhangella rawalii]